MVPESRLVEARLAHALGLLGATLVLGRRALGDLVGRHGAATVRRTVPEGSSRGRRGPAGGGQDVAAHRLTAGTSQQ